MSRMAQVTTYAVHQCILRSESDYENKVNIRTTIVRQNCSLSFIYVIINNVTKQKMFLISSFLNHYIFHTISLRLPRPGRPGSRIYIPQEQGGPVKYVYVCVFGHNSGTPGAILTKLGTHIAICMCKNLMYVLYIFLREDGGRQGIIAVAR
jgi:hypothetical protein